MFVSTYLESVRSSYREGLAEPRLPVVARAIWLYSAVLLLCVIGWLVGPEQKPHLVFREGAPADGLSAALLFTTAMIAWAAWLTGPERWRNGNWFWGASALGLVFLVVDERFQLHERLYKIGLREFYGDPPLGLKNWNDLALIVYGLAAGVLLLLALPAIVRHRAFRVFLGAALACFLAHTALDVLLPREPFSTAVEETFKLLAGVGFVLAYLHVLVERKAECPLLPRGGIALGIFALTAAFVTIAVTAGPELLKQLYHKWGNPISWISSVLLAGASLGAAFLALPRRLGPPRERRLWLAAAVAFGLIALAEAAVACTGTVNFAAGIWGREREALRMLRFLFGPPGNAISMALVGGLVLAGWKRLAEPRMLRYCLLFSLAAYAGLLLTGLVPAIKGSHVSFLRGLAAAGVASTSLVALADRSRGRD